MRVSPAVLYRDDSLLIIDKPSGSSVASPTDQEKKNIVRLLNERVAVGSQRKLHPCHRLDQETSGVLVLAWGKRCQQAMMDLFRQRKVKKTYLAFVKGRVVSSSGRVNTPVENHYQKRFHSRRGPRPAETRYRVVARDKDFSVVEAVPLTGRTHQIRIHFRTLGHPLLGERIYAFRKDFTVDMPRLALHAVKICFPHPVSGKTIEVRSPLPGDMQMFLKKFACWQDVSASGAV